jgi:valyl-tRNA synthetase
MVRSHLEFDSVPWTNAALSGWILDPDRKKMSKSKGNVVTPMALLEQFGSDAVRYWAARGSPGTDTAFDEGQMKVGRRLAIKVLNASKFVLGVAGDTPADAALVVAPVDRAFLSRLAALVEEATAAFEGYDYTRALERTEAFFWSFCDVYLELVKGRGYGALGEDEAVSARATLRLALSTFLRLFAPFLPFVTEEVWSWWQEGSVHRAPWPTASELAPQGGTELLDLASWVLGRIRSAKTEHRQSMRAPVAQVVVKLPADEAGRLREAEADLREAGNVASLEIVPGEGEPSVDVILLQEDG